MASDDIVLVQEESTGDFGLYHPDEDVIETYVGNDREEIPGDYVGVNWHEAEKGDLRKTIEEGIEYVRDRIEELRSEDLANEQARELDRLESHLESQENVLQLAEEVNADE